MKNVTVWKVVANNNELLFEFLGSQLTTVIERLAGKDRCGGIRSLIFFLKENIFPQSLQVFTTTYEDCAQIIILGKPKLVQGKEEKEAEGMPVFFGITYQENTGVGGCGTDQYLQFHIFTKQEIIEYITADIGIWAGSGFCFHYSENIMFGNEEKSLKLVKRFKKFSPLTPMPKNNEKETIMRLLERTVIYTLPAPEISFVDIFKKGYELKEVGLNLPI